MRQEEAEKRLMNGLIIAALSRRQEAEKIRDKRLNRYSTDAATEWLDHCSTDAATRKER